jgi:nucleoside-diphosphate-sugar epimerase
MPAVGTEHLDMNVLIIGATGYLGSAIDEALDERGHRTFGVARSAAARQRLAQRGTAIVEADAARPQTLVAPMRDADAVVYAANITDADNWSVGANALRAIRKGLAGSEKTFVYISTAWVYGATGRVPAGENFPLNPPLLVLRRLEHEHLTLDMTKVGIRSLVVRPGIVYGDGGGVPSMFVQSARERGAATIVGDGTNHWATIGLADLGSLVSLAVERGLPGRAYNAVNDDHPQVHRIAEAASRGAGAGGATKVVPQEVMGLFGDCLALDQHVSAERAKTDLGWQPCGPTIIEEMERGSYIGASAA